MEKLTILCAANSEMGHMYAIIGVAVALKNRGHRVVVSTDKSWEGKLVKFGLEEQLYKEWQQEEQKVGKQWSEHMSQFEQMLSQTNPEEKLKMMATMLTKMMDTASFCNGELEAIVKRVKPDVIVEDYVMPFPALLQANVPIVKLYSVAPLIIFNDENLPPFGCGLPLNDKTEWQRCRQVIDDTMAYTAKCVKEWFEKMYPGYPIHSSTRTYKSTNLNIYMYPKCLVEDYLKLCALGEEWLCVDHCIREPFGEFEVPEKLRNRPGKLIFLSLGSMGNSFVGLMKKLISILSKSKHNFIVSTGYRNDEYELAANMWGQPFVPQLAVLQRVDLVLTHGGNNSFIESLYFGKPIIVLPLFSDQYDNGQRAVEMKIGRTFDPFKVTESELNDAIESLLLDTEVTENVSKISKELHASKSMQEAIERIEYVAKYPKFPTIA